MPVKLYLIPSTIGDADIGMVIPSGISSIINSLTQYIVEDERSARRMLIKLGLNKPVDELTFSVLNEHTGNKNLPAILEFIKKADTGILSEAGVPAIADPGSNIILMAHTSGIEVIPLVGPSSILMAMMASGLNGQNFAFNGYLPVKPHERVKKIRQLEKRSETEKQSQIFIEAPYRNHQLVTDILKNCAENTLLCIASNITSSSAVIKTKPVAEWCHETIDIHKQPAIFILQKY